MSAAAGVSLDARDIADPLDLSAAAGLTPANPNDPLTVALAYDIAQRDSADRVMRVNLQIGGQDPLEATYAYDANTGRLVVQGGTGYANGQDDPATYTYNERSGRLERRAMRFPAVSTLHGDIDTVYTYSASGRLKGYSAAGSSFVTAHTFNGGGSLTKVKNSSTEISFDYTLRQRLKQGVFATQSGTETTIYAMEAENGRRDKQGPSNNLDARDFSWRADGTLESVHDESGATSSYTYDGEGQRLRKEVSQGGTTTTIDYTYDSLTLLALSASVTNSSDVETERYGISYLYDAEGRPYGAYYEECGIDTATGEPDPESAKSAWFALLSDLRGDVLELLDADGARFASYRYSVWGSPSGGTKSRATAALASDATLAAHIAERQELRYAGYAYDAEHELYYCQARYYDPVTRAFLSRDPAKADGIASAYQYCAGNPTLASDPTGERPVAGSNDASDADEGLVTIRDPETGQWIGMSYEVASLLSGPWSGANAAPAPGSPGAPGVNVQVTADALAGAFAVPIGDLGAGAGGLLAGKYLAWFYLGFYDEEMSQYMDGAAKGGLTGIAFIAPGGGGKVGFFRKLFARGDDVARATAKGAASGANSANAGSALRSKLSALQNAQQGAARIRTLPDGRLRYYGPEIPAANLGSTRGASYVTEYNPRTGQVRSWMESYDHAGKVTRVHPKMINGQQVYSQHYPPTAREL